MTPTGLQISTFSRSDLNENGEFIHIPAAGTSRWHWFNFTCRLRALVASTSCRHWINFQNEKMKSLHNSIRMLQGLNRDSKGNCK